MTEEVAKILLVRSYENHTAESVLIEADCGHKCWASPSAIRTIANTDVQTWTSCQECFGYSEEDLEQFMLAGETGLLPGVREELERMYGKRKVKKFLKKYNITHTLGDDE